MILSGAGILSAVLMNDTLAVVGTPVMLILARKHSMPARPLLLALAFGVTIGSVFSPIGNPQNLLIALHGGLANPFVDFLRRLLLPVLMRAGGGLPELMALGAGSTIAGNLTILGAASNVIIVQSAERRGGGSITFFEFARVGVPLTIVNGTVYWLFLKYF
jgi:Na+/H+ antiporter NhaD/arsenite permease-like protein